MKKVFKTGLMLGAGFALGYYWREVERDVLQGSSVVDRVTPSSMENREV